MMTLDNAIRLGEVADDVDALLAMMAAPKAHVHMGALPHDLRRVRDELRAIFVAEVGEDPWD